MVRAGRSIADYDALFDRSAGPRGQKRQAGGRPGQGGAGAAEIVAAVNPPVHLLLGNDALKFVREKLFSLADEISQWGVVSTSTDHAD